LEYKPYRQKDGALLAIGALCDKLKQTDPYKSELERMLVQHVFPEFSSPAGHLRAKVHCSFSSFFFEIIFCLAFYILAIPVVIGFGSLMLIAFPRLQSLYVSSLRVSLFFFIIIIIIIGVDIRLHGLLDNMLTLTSQTRTISVKLYTVLFLGCVIQSFLCVLTQFLHCEALLKPAKV